MDSPPTHNLHVHALDPHHPRPATPAGLGGALDVALVLQFFDAGHDVILALDPAAGPELRELASELGVDVDAAEARVLDHSAYDGALAATAHDVVHADVSVGLNRHVFPAGIHVRI